MRNVFLFEALEGRRLFATTGLPTDTLTPSAPLAAATEQPVDTRLAAPIRYTRVGPNTVRVWFEPSADGKMPTGTVSFAPLIVSQPTALAIPPTGVLEFHLRDSASWVRDYHVLTYSGDASFKPWRDAYVHFTQYRSGRRFAAVTISDPFTRVGETVTITSKIELGRPWGPASWIGGKVAVLWNGKEIASQTQTNNALFTNSFVVQPGMATVTLRYTSEETHWHEATHEVSLAPVAVPDATRPAAHRDGKPVVFRKTEMHSHARVQLRGADGTVPTGVVYYYTPATDGSLTLSDVLYGQQIKVMTAPVEADGSAVLELSYDQRTGLRIHYGGDAAHGGFVETLWPADAAAVTMYELNLDPIATVDTGGRVRMTGIVTTGGMADAGRVKVVRISDGAELFDGPAVAGSTFTCEFDATLRNAAVRVVFSSGAMPQLSMVREGYVPVVATRPAVSAPTMVYGHVGQPVQVDVTFAGVTRPDQKAVLLGQGGTVVSEATTDANGRVSFSAALGFGWHTLTAVLESDYHERVGSNLFEVTVTPPGQEAHATRVTQGQRMAAVFDPAGGKVHVRSGYYSFAQHTALAAPKSGDWTLRGIVPDDNAAALIWQNNRTGVVVRWRLTVLGKVREVTSLARASGWSLAAIRDHNGDGHTDLVWKHAQSGKRALWIATSRSLFGRVEILPV